MNPQPDRTEIRIAAGIVKNKQGETLLVRKRGTSAFMQPGGKVDEGEDDLRALAREFQEELGCRVHLERTTYLGRFRALAANEPGAVVDAALYQVDLSELPTPGAEIAELIWLHADAETKPVLAPLTEYHVLPIARRQEAMVAAPRVLFICKGNWFRSQMAAAIYNKRTSSCAADSAGTYVGAADEPEGQVLADLFPTPDFFEAMEHRGMYVRANATRRLSPDMLSGYDLIVSMAEEPYVPQFLRDASHVIWWEVENPKIVDRPKAEEMFALVDGLVGTLIA